MVKKVFKPSLLSDFIAEWKWCFQKKHLIRILDIIAAFLFLSFLGIAVYMIYMVFAYGIHRYQFEIFVN